ncbi:MAG TPA: hypothetical protein VM165_21150 [Planctomycetaceae bacterium]|nr:hypothetical protein [Planctomycetaceae bacterium]
MAGEICLIGDSFGTRRVHGCEVEVSDDGTWPQQVRQALSMGMVDVDFEPFRKLTECPALLASRSDCRLAIVQAGVVDCYPRPLPQGLSRSPSLMCKVLRRCIRPVRRAWVNYVHSTTWSVRDEMVLAIEALLSQSATRMTGFVTVAPLLREHAIYTPGAQEAIFEFNDLLRETVARFPRAFVLDLHTALLAEGHRRYLSPWDSHLNQAGNDWLAQAVLQQIAARIGSARTLSVLKAAA